jgi:PhnB protein
MAVKAVPEGFQTITPYLVVPDAAALIDFLRRAFGAEETHRTKRPDGSIMHAQVKIGSSMLMMSSATPEWPARPSGLYLYVEDADRWHQRAIEAGATSVLEPMDAFWGDRMGGVLDMAGNHWWIATHREDVPEDEIARRATAELASRA